MSAGQLVKFGTVSEVTNMHGGDRCRYTILLAHPVAALESKLTDIAEVALFLAAFKTNAMTGESIIVSHGWHMN